MQKKKKEKKNLRRLQLQLVSSWNRWLDGGGAPATGQTYATTKLQLSEGDL